MTKLISPSAEPIFWLLPGPAAFVDALASTIPQARALAVAAQGRPVIGFWAAVQRALEAAHASSDQVQTLNVDDGSHIESDIGHHVGAASITAARLAHWSGPGHRTFVLVPKSPRAVDKCWQYLSGFSEALHANAGADQETTRLIVVRDDSGPAWRRAPCLEQVIFSGALSPEEMKAYVAMRMIGRRGPGSTDLTQRLVAEFAGFDAGFAEELMVLSEQELMNLPNSLATVAHRLPTLDSVWRDSRLETGSIAEIDGGIHAHVLHEWHLASHDGPMREAATRDMASRYWRACLSALMPWMEERRHRVIDVLKPALERHLAPTGGVRRRVTANQSKVIEVPIVELECNDIVQMKFDRSHPFVVTDSADLAAMHVCSKVTKVRNDLAHLKCPEPMAVVELVRAMDELLR